MEVPLALKNELKAIQLEWEIIVNKMSQGVTEGWDSCIGERSWSIDTQPEEAKKKTNPLSTQPNHVRTVESCVPLYQVGPGQSQTMIGWIELQASLSDCRA